MPGAGTRQGPPAAARPAPGGDRGEPSAQSRGLRESPRIQRDLKAAGHRVSRKRGRAADAGCGLRGVGRRRVRVLTRSAPGQPVAPNHLASRSTAGQPERVWLADLTYCWTAQDWLYLAVLLDLTSHRVVGWATDRGASRGLPLHRGLVQSAPPALGPRSRVTHDLRAGHVRGSLNPKLLTVHQTGGTPRERNRAGLGQMPSSTMLLRRCALWQTEIRGTFSADDCF
jgi:hypothetical protein